MMKNLLTAQQIKEWDAHTIMHQKITSNELMEQVAVAFTRSFIKKVKKKKSISIFCGKGNNGGDGLVIARLLSLQGYKKVKVYIANFSSKQSDDFAENLERLKKTTVEITSLSKADDLIGFSADVIIDAILGAGLNKPLRDEFEKLVTKINQSNSEIIAVDIPTGFKSEGKIENYNGIKAHLTITFELPKINFFFPESAQAQNAFEVVNIGLEKAFLKNQESTFKLITKSAVSKVYRPRQLFTHKGTYGHALIVAGNDKTMGAAILAAMGCIYGGAGLTTVMLPQSGLTAMNISLPEAMILPREKALVQKTQFERFKAIAVGPGLGTDANNHQLFQDLIGFGQPLVVDADAINILSENKQLLQKLPKESIITPHLKEFDRLFGTHQSWWGRVETARAKALELGIVILLKNQYTFICLPTGDVLINQTGNPAMASGGMGDVLTGVITAFVTQGYSATDAAILAVYLHGKAGDELAEKRVTVTAKQVAKQIPKVLRGVIKNS